MDSPVVVSMTGLDMLILRRLLFLISTLGTDVVGVKGLGYGANDGDWVMVLVLKDDSKM